MSDAPVTLEFLAEQVVALATEVARLRRLVEEERENTDVIGFRREQDRA